MDNVKSINDKKYKDLTLFQLQQRAALLESFFQSIDMLGGHLSFLHKDAGHLIPEYNGIMQPIKFQYEYLVSCYKETKTEISVRMEIMSKNSG